MYRLELHTVEIDDNDREPQTFERQLGGTSGFSTLEAVEAKLVELAEDPNTEWENAFAVSADGVDAYWYRLSSEDRTGGATDLKIGYAPAKYTSAHYVNPGSKWVAEPWDGSMTLSEAHAWAAATAAQDPKLEYIVLFDPKHQRVACAWMNPPIYKGIVAPLGSIAIGEHIV